MIFLQIPLDFSFHSFPILSSSKFPFKKSQRKERRRRKKSMTSWRVSESKSRVCGMRIFSCCAVFLQKMNFEAKFLLKTQFNPCWAILTFSLPLSSFSFSFPFTFFSSSLWLHHFVKRKIRLVMILLRLHLHSSKIIETWWKRERKSWEKEDERKTREKERKRWEKRA